MEQQMIVGRVYPLQEYRTEKIDKKTITFGRRKRRIRKPCDGNCKDCEFIRC